MSHLTVYSENDPSAPIVDTRDFNEIVANLKPIGVWLERWPTRPLPAAAASDDVLAAYSEEIDRLTNANGYRSVDVMRIAPDHPDRAALRTKFLSEHTHAEDEVRFFVEGAGLFTLHKDGKVFNMLCEQDDLLGVPAGIRHWFDMGAAPHFTVIRLFTTPEGWVAEFTGDDIADRFPRLEPVAA